MIDVEETFAEPESTATIAFEPSESVVMVAPSIVAVLPSPTTTIAELSP